MSGYTSLLPPGTSGPWYARRLWPVALVVVVGLCVWTVSSVDVHDSLAGLCESTIKSPPSSPSSASGSPNSSSTGVLKKASEGVLKQHSRPVANDESYTTNLLPNVSYVTHHPLAGWTNEVIGQFNLLHLAVLQNSRPSGIRTIPLLSPFTPEFSHLYEKADKSPRSAPVLRFSEVFDIDRLAQSLGFGIVEWAELKQGKPGRHWDTIYEDEWMTEAERAEIRHQRPTAEDWPTFEAGRKPETEEKLGCWSHQMTRNGDDPMGNAKSVELYYNIRMYSTPLPSSLVPPRDSWTDGWVILPALANWLFPVNNFLQQRFLEGRADGEAERMIKSWGRGKTVDQVLGKSDESHRVRPATELGQVTCLEDMFHTSDHGQDVNDVYGWRAMNEHETGPWMTVGRHARWSPSLEKQAHDLLLRLIGLPTDAAVPPIFTLHIRRGDFFVLCGNPEGCLSVAVFARHLSEMRDKMIANGRPDAANWPVVVTTDDESEEFTADIHAAGWHRVDHVKLKTKERFGIWAPTLLDSVVLSMGQGFIGVDMSTMSAMAARRVHYWHGGEVTMISTGEE